MHQFSNEYDHQAHHSKQIYSSDRFGIYEGNFESRG